MNSYPSKGEIVEPISSKKQSFVMPETSFFGILKDPTAYRSILYILLLFPLSIGLFVYSITMASLALGLAITIFGLPLAYIFLISLPRLNVIQAGMAEVVLGVPMPTVKISSPQGGFIDRLVSLTKDPQVQSSLVSTILLFPFAILAFVLVVTSLSVSIPLTLVILYPVVRSILYSAGVEFDGDIYMTGALEFIPEIVLLGSISVIGFFLFILSLHLIRFLAYSHANVIHYIIS